MNKVYFVESELYPRTDFAKESDRNERALALWEEQIYFLWARTVNWYGDDGIMTDIEKGADNNIFTWEEYVRFNNPTQVAFWDSEGSRYIGGIAYGTEIICGCCGGTVEINEVYEFAPCGVTPIVVYKNWVPFDEEFIGDDERDFEWEEEEFDDVEWEVT